LIQDYFGKTIGHVKKVFLTYGPQGRSRGIAQIIFSGPTSGPEAAKKLDGVKVDNRAMRVSSMLLPSCST
jgi:THO complex subunit 4